MRHGVDLQLVQHLGHEGVGLYAAGARGEEPRRMRNHSPVTVSFPALDEESVGDAVEALGFTGSSTRDQFVT